MRAIVLAAGEGTRLRPYTQDRPKCLVPLCDRPLLAWQIDALRAAGIHRITVVTGYRADAIEALGVPTVHNAAFAATNMVASLMCARALLDGSDDVLVAYGDLVYEPRVVEALTASPAPLAISVDRGWRRLWSARMADPLADAETLRLDASGHVIELGRRPRSYDDIEGQYMGLVLARASVVRRLVDQYDALDPAGPYDGRTRDQMFMTTFLQHLIDQAVPVAATLVDGGWLEVDTTDDLATYEALARAGRLAELCSMHGG